MVIDSSAIVAIVFGEPERESFLERIHADSARLISAATLVEVGIVLDSRYGPRAAMIFEELLQRLRLEVMAFGEAQAGLAREAYRRFGKGRHPAGLNFGDCFSYALAKETGEPLLFKGDDFSRTDVDSVVG